MELVHIIENVYYLPNTTNIGVIHTQEGAVLIDSGLDSDTGKKILKCIDNAGMKLRAIINTHSHADHFGGNAVLVEKTGAEVYAPQIEAELIRCPIVEPLYLSCGANPLPEMRSKFVMGKPSPVDHVLQPGTQELVFGSERLKLVPLPGHALNQIGIEIHGVLFCADALFSEEVLLKHGIPFCVDPARQRDTLKLLADSSYSRIVPSHGEPVENAGPMSAAYLQILQGVEDFLLKLLADAKTGSEVLMELCNRFGIVLRGIQQHHLMNTVTQAYLNSLCSRGAIGYELEHNVLCWRSK